MMTVFAAILILAMFFGTLMIIESICKDWLRFKVWLRHRRHHRKPMATRPRRRYSLERLP